MRKNKLNTMKQTWLLAFFLLCVGCASKQVPLLSGFTSEGAPVCLTGQAGIPEAVQKFYLVRDLTAEETKIDYLLERLRTSNLTLIRNRVEYTGTEAAQFLRWKLDRFRTRHHMKIETAQDFISQITSGSKMSGEPYAVVLTDGSRHNLQYILQNELDALESCLKQTSSKSEEEQAVVHSNSS